MTESKDKNKTYMPRQWGGVAGEAKEKHQMEGKPRHSRHHKKFSHHHKTDDSKKFKDEEKPVVALDDEGYTEDSDNGSEYESDLSEWSPEPDESEEIFRVDRPSDSSEPKIAVKVCGVRFGYACKIYHFDTDDLPLTMADWVIVKTEKGMGLGQIALAPFTREIEVSQLENLRKVLRKATKADFDQKNRCAQKENEAYVYCLERVEVLDLPMKLVAVECFFDGSKYVFYFTAEGRVDFRELVKQLVARFPVRIEMRQIGVRHEAKMTGGLACCGQELCCSRFLTDFRPVSVKMAKTQNLSLNPTKISGVCGRLMCCLSYEHSTYEDFKKGLPRVGKTVQTAQGSGVVQKHNPLAETMFVKVDEETVIEVTREEIIRDPEKSASKKISKPSDEDRPEESSVE